MQLLSGHVLSISETGCKDLGKGLPSALSPKEKILVESFETKKKKEVFFVCLFVCLFVFLRWAKRAKEIIEIQFTKYLLSAC